MKKFRVEIREVVTTVREQWFHAADEEAAGKLALTAWEAQGALARLTWQDVNTPDTVVEINQIEECR